LGSHVAALGVAFSTPSMGSKFADGVFVGEHGSWNRQVLNGYKVVYVPFANGKPSGAPQDVVTGFLDSHDNARGRPVGLALDKSGALLIADDVGDTVWRVTSSNQPQVTQR
jgi:glucose/arabinose dehydrogenase